METYQFRLRLEDSLSDDEADRLYGAFDEEIGIEEGPKGNFVGFERQADTFLDAVLDAVAQVIEVGIEPIAIEDELVSMADIGERSGRTRQSISMLVSGERGPGGFPRPIAGNVRSPLWHWADVAAWLETNKDDRMVFEDRTRTIASINGILAMRALNLRRATEAKILKRFERKLAG